jgi:3-oxoacyl-[acyl-carrier-protein] synthase II
MRVESAGRAYPQRRVVVTGMGLLSPAGCDLDAYWRGITSGRSAIRAIRNFDTGEMPVHSGGEVDQSELLKAVPESAIEHTDRTALFGLIAARRALEDAALADSARDGARIGLLIGSGLGPCETVAESYALYDSRGWQSVRPTTVPRSMYNVIASHISMECHLLGGHHVVAAACASGALAMADACEWIQSGREDMVVTGGCDSPIIPSIFGAWINLRVMSKNPEPARASRPFDRRRDGLVLAEGAGMLIFEEAEHALRRGARIYAEVLGSGSSSDATHITKPSPEGQASAIRHALRVAGLAAEEVDYINAHGTSTLLNDSTETQAIKLALGEHARRVAISSTKSVIGHTMGASGALELIATILAIRSQVLPPTVNLDEPDPQCDLDYVPNVARPARIRAALSNSFAFGGSNAVLAVRAYEG